jgi:hypothetical protein
MRAMCHYWNHNNNWNRSNRILDIYFRYGIEWVGWHAFCVVQSTHQAKAYLTWSVCLEWDVCCHVSNGNRIPLTSRCLGKHTTGVHSWLQWIMWRNIERETNPGEIRVRLTCDYFSQLVAQDLYNILQSRRWDGKTLGDKATYVVSC